MWREERESLAWLFSRSLSKAERACERIKEMREIERGDAYFSPSVETV